MPQTLYGLRRSQELSSGDIKSPSEGGGFHGGEDNYRTPATNHVAKFTSPDTTRIDRRVEWSLQGPVRNGRNISMRQTYQTQHIWKLSVSSLAADNFPTYELP